MSSTAIATIVKMLESLPEATQNQIMDHLREYIEKYRTRLNGTLCLRELGSNLL